MSLLRKLNTEIKSNYEHPLRVRGLLKKREETLKQFIIKFFTKWNPDKSTIFATKNPEIQCQPGRRRSIGDVFMICKYYYPRCTFKQVAQIVYVDLFNEVPKFRSSYCSVIHRRVFYVGTDTEQSVIYNKDQEDEFGNKFDDYVNALKE